VVFGTVDRARLTRPVCPPEVATASGSTGTSLLGVVDRVLELRHDEQDPNGRILRVLSRIVRARDLLLPVDGEGWPVVLSDAAAAEVERVMAACLDVLEPEAWLKTSEVRDRVPEPRPTQNRVLKVLRDFWHEGTNERITREDRQRATYRDQEGMHYEQGVAQDQSVGPAYLMPVELDLLVGREQCLDEEIGLERSRALDSHGDRFSGDALVHVQRDDVDLEGGVLGLPGLHQLWIEVGIVGVALGLLLVHLVGRREACRQVVETTGIVVVIACAVTVPGPSPGDDIHPFHPQRSGSHKVARTAGPVNR